GASRPVRLPVRFWLLAHRPPASSGPARERDKGRSGRREGNGMTSITEKCGCGASVTYDGIQALTAVTQWRREHQCSVVTPGLCWNQPKGAPTWPHGGEKIGRASCRDRE